MGSTSFLRRVSLHKLRKSLSASNGDESRPVTAEEPSPEQPQIPVTPKSQTVLLLHGPRQPYQLTESYPVPQPRGDRELLVKTRTIGLNPVDWKSP